MIIIIIKNYFISEIIILLLKTYNSIINFMFNVNTISISDINNYKFLNAIMLLNNYFYNYDSLKKNYFK